jgi:orotate phosphoribosyltransferase
MIYNIDIAKQIAKSLLQINAIILQPNDPFKWASGWNSPIYCDNRKTLSYPKIRNYIRKGLAAIIKNHYKGANVIAGVATAGIPHGALVAEELGLPFIYVRSKAKNHGKQNQIEGCFEKGQSVILIEDLISSGKSSLEAATTLKEAGMNVKGMASIFTYGFDTASENFQKANCEYVSLCNYNTLLPEAIKQKYINKEDLSILKEWKEDPSNW